MLLVYEFIVNFDHERDRPLVKLSPRAKDPTGSYPNTNGELTPPRQLPSTGAEGLVIVELLHCFEDQSFSYFGTLSKFSGGCFDVGPKRCLRERRRSPLVEVKRGETFQFPESFLSANRIPASWRKDRQDPPPKEKPPTSQPNKTINAC